MCRETARAALGVRLSFCSLFHQQGAQSPQLNFPGSHLTLLLLFLRRHFQSNWTIEQFLSGRVFLVLCSEGNFREQMVS